MKLVSYLNDNPECVVQALCRACGRDVVGHRIVPNNLTHALYTCPHCSSINLRIILVTEVAADGRTLVIYQKGN